MWIINPRTRTTARQRQTLWVFERVDTFRTTILHRAGRLTYPAGKITLTFCAVKHIKERVSHIFGGLHTAA